jgi:hypothetical protein
MALLPVADISLLRLEPGDALVVRLDTDTSEMSPGYLDRVTATLRDSLRIAGSVPVLVLGRGESVEVASAAAPGA